MEEAKEIFESHGYLIDIWQHGLGSGNYLQFVMLSVNQERSRRSPLKHCSMTKNGLQNSWTGSIKKSTEVLLRATK